MPTVLISAPYMIPTLERFRAVLAHYKVDLIVAPVDERLSEDQILGYAGQFDGAVCGDDRYTERALEACHPRLKVIAKWGTGIDSIDRAAADRLGIQVRNTPNAFTLPVADSVLGYILTFARQLPWMDRVELGREIRGAFVAEPGHVLISADYSQIELRVLAHLSGDETLVEAFRRGEDIHDQTARRVFGTDSGLGKHELRRRAKIINYALLYGKTAFTLSKDIGVTPQEAQAFLRRTRAQMEWNVPSIMPSIA